MNSKKLSRDDVFKAADFLFHKGENPTAKKIRSFIGSGSLTTITKFLNDWKLDSKNEEVNFNKLISQIPEAKLADFFGNEHLQVCALVFSNLEVGKVASILSHFSKEMRVDVLNRIEVLGPVQSSTVEAIFNVLKTELAVFAEARVEQFGGSGFAEKVRKELVG